jgi:hypothetical protein
LGQALFAFVMIFLGDDATSAARHDWREEGREKAWREDRREGEWEHTEILVGFGVLIGVRD